jgi:L-threonylcarbamoyladenylate synthase
MTEIDGGSSPAVFNAASAQDLVRAASILRNGGVVVVPTDTVYGLAAGVLHPAAVQRVFDLKGRAPDAPVPVLLATAADLPMLVRTVPEIAWSLIERYWPGPLTLALPARDSVDRIITAGKTTVAVRVPANRAVLQLLQTLGEPIVGTSANRSGHGPFVRGLDALHDLGDGVDAVLLDDEHVGSGQVSTVAEVRTDMVVIHRAGAVSLDDIRRVTGVRVVPVQTLADLTQTR